MTSLWVLIGLIISTVAVSGLGAAFSVFGLADLFSGAVISVILMSASLEFAKFFIAAYLHQAWPRLRWVFKSYLFVAVVILSLITSMGIFGYLSGAYQEASSKLETENIKLASLKADQARFTAEIERINKSIDEIPVSRISKKRVGPLIYIAKAFNIDIDTVVKYLILIFVSVFDPLAICLVIAVSESLVSRQHRTQRKPQAATEAAAGPQPTPAPVAAVTPMEPIAEDETIHMRFAPDKKKVI